QVCALPHVPFPDSYPAYVSKDLFLTYLDDYASRFNIAPLFRRRVESAEFDEATNKWIVKAKNLDSGEVEEFAARFLAVASGETCDPYTPEIEGLNTFPGEVLHSTQYRNGKAFKDKNVLVVGAGNSGMEISLDLANHGVKTSIVIRSPIHILSKEMVYWGEKLLRFIPFNTVDKWVALAGRVYYGDLTKYGITRPEQGPFLMKAAYGKICVVDLGTCSKIKSGEIQVLPAISNIRGNEVVFNNGKTHPFDSIILCTGFKRSTKLWLKGDDYLLNEDGFSKQKPPSPTHWKGKNGLYCVGLSRGGLFGAATEADNIADDIYNLLSN
ncbi:Flavin monooxygenase-like protein, partial [Corchorus capsularis]